MIPLLLLWSILVNSWVKVVENWNGQCFVFRVPVSSTCWNEPQSFVYDLIGKELQLDSFSAVVCLWCGKHFVQMNNTMFNFYTGNLGFLSIVLTVRYCCDCNFIIIILTCSMLQITLASLIVSGDLVCHSVLVPLTVPITPPAMNHVEYYNHKGWHSMSPAE